MKYAKSCIFSVQSLVDDSMIESDMGDDFGLKDIGALTNAINA